MDWPQNRLTKRCVYLLPPFTHYCHLLVFPYHEPDFANREFGQSSEQRSIDIQTCFVSGNISAPVGAHDTIRAASIILNHEQSLIQPPPPHSATTSSVRVLSPVGLMDAAQKHTADPIELIGFVIKFFFLHRNVF